MSERKYTCGVDTLNVEWTIGAHAFSGWCETMAIELIPYPGTTVTQVISTAHTNAQGSNLYAWTPDSFNSFCDGVDYRIKLTCSPGTSLVYYTTDFALNATLKSTCSEGQYLVGTICASCPAGWYQPNQFQTSCLSCPAGNVQTNTGATTCDDACAAENIQILAPRCA